MNKNAFLYTLTGLFLLIAAGIRRPLFAQPKPTLLFKHLHMEDGLSDPTVRMFHRDRNGFLWMGTENGLTRFDGSQTRVYKHNPNDSLSLPGDYIVHIIEDREGDLWVGTQRRLAKYRYADDTFHSLRFPDLGDPDRNYYAFPFFIDYRGHVWVHLAGNIYTFRPGNSALTFISTYSNGYQFINQPFYTPLKYFVSRGTKGIYVNRLKNNKEDSRLDFFMNRNDRSAPVSYIDDVCFDGDSILWLAGDPGLIALEPETGRFRQYNSYLKKKGIFATCIIPYPDKPWLLIGTHGDGVLLFDKQSREFIGQYKHVPNDPSSLSGNQIRKMYLDRDGNLFVAVSGRGVDYTNLNRAQFIRYFTKEDANELNLENHVTSVFEDKYGRIWCGTNASGILVYNSSMTTVLRHALHHTAVRHITPLNDDELLIQLINGSFIRFSYATETFEAVSIRSSLKTGGSDAINQIIHMPDGTLFACTESGLGRLKRPASGELFVELDSEANKGMMWPNVQRVIPLTHPYVLVQTYYTNMYLYTYEQGHFKVVREVCQTPFYTSGAVLKGNTLYLSTTSGLLRFDTRTMTLDEQPVIQAYCTGIAEDDSQGLWISSSSGLYRYQPGQTGPAHYGIDDGLQDMVTSRNSLARFRDGRIAVGGPNGMNVFRPDSIERFIAPYRIAITDISINDRPYPEAGNSSVKKKLQLRYDQHTIGLSFTPVDYSIPNQRVITYQLQPFDQSPVTVTGSATIRYPQMPPGEYRLVLDGQGASEQTILDITITPPFWKTWWFRSGLILLVALSAFGIVKLYVSWIRNSQLRRMQLMIRSQEDERKRIARDLHDDFGARLSSLKHYMQAAGSRKTENDPEIRQLSTELVDQAICELRNILLNLSPKTLEENGLAAALQDLADNITKLNLIRLHLDVTTFHVRLKDACEYGLYRISQELINNTIKHASAKNVFISLVVRDKQIIVLYEDDGIGFDPEHVKKGYGLHNVETHTQAIQGDLVIDSSRGKGLAVTITLAAGPSIIKAGTINGKKT